MDHLEGKDEKGPRHAIIYFSIDGDLTALRFMTTGKLILMG